MDLRKAYDWKAYPHIYTHLTMYTYIHLETGDWLRVGARTWLWFLIACHVLLLSACLPMSESVINNWGALLSGIVLFQHSKELKTQGPKHWEENNIMATLLFLYIMGEIFTYATHRQTLTIVENMFVAYQLWTRELKWIWGCGKSVTVKGKQEVSRTAVQRSQTLCFHGLPVLVACATAGQIISYFH